VYFHCCIVDGVFAPAVDNEAAGVVFHAAFGLDALAIADVQALVRRRVLRAFVRRGLIDKSDGDEMAGWERGGGF
jgi:Putative transposase